MLDIEKARAEILSKTTDQINEETAWTWASRAVAAILESDKVTIDEEREDLRLRSADFYHEALEHAALVGKDSSFLQKIMDATRESSEAK